MAETVTGRWSTGALVRAIALAFLFLILLRFAWVARMIFIVTFLGILAGLALSAAAGWLHQRWHVKRAVGAVSIMALFLGLLAGIGALIAPTLTDQARELQEKLPQSLDRVDRWLGRKTQVLSQTVAASPGAASGAQQQQQQQQQQKQQQQQRMQRSLREQLAQPLREIARHLFPFISSMFSALTGIVLIIFISIYMAADPDLYRRGALHLVPHAHRERAGEVLSSIGDALRRWLIARLLAMLAIGTVTTVVLMLLKVRAAVALGVIAGLLEFVPFFGPIVSAIPAVGVALLDSPQKALWVVLAFVAIQQLEGNVVTPLLLKNRVQVPPLLTIVSVAALGAALGIAGMLIAEPLMTAVLIATQMLYVEDVVGDKVHESSDE